MLTAFEPHSNDNVEPPTQFRVTRSPVSSPASSHRLLCFEDHTNMPKDISSEDIRYLCRRFRVLIIGRRNAGKTTILEKMTGSDVGAKPVIHDKEGRLVVRAHISNTNSQADGHRMTQHLSRQGWRSVESIRISTYSPTPLTKIPAWDERD